MHANERTRKNQLRKNVNNGFLFIKSISLNGRLRLSLQDVIALQQSALFYSKPIILSLITGTI